VGDQVAIAAMNNVLQSEAVLAALGSRGTFTDDFWTNEHAFDVPYANGATLGAATAAASHYAAIERLTAARPSGAPTYIMDSWTALDLAPLGYQIRLADEWFIRALPVEQRLEPRVESIASAARLAEFEAASVAGFGAIPPATAGHTYHPSLLDDDRFHFFGARIDGDIVAGVMLFRESRCTGVYTFFTLPDFRGHGLGSAVLRHALNHAPDTLLATNPSPLSRRIFERLGFQPVGERRIWMRPARDRRV
jgi:GNAT superfamily N-acetyltransferase